MTTTHEGQDAGRHEPAAVPPIVDRETWQAARDELLVREKAHMRAGDAIAAARRRLPMTEVDATITVVGPDGPCTLLDLFEGAATRTASGTTGPVGGRPSSGPALALRLWPHPASTTSTENGRYVNHNASVEDGREANRSFWRQWFTAFPDTAVSLDDVLVDGDRVAGRFTYRATFQGEFMGLRRPVSRW